MRPTMVIVLVGLTSRHLGQDMPHVSALARAGAVRPLTTVMPAVTCTVQATFMTGLKPCDHGIVANGWLFRDLLEIWLWRQSTHSSMTLFFSQRSTMLAPAAFLSLDFVGDRSKI